MQEMFSFKSMVIFLAVAFSLVSCDSCTHKVPKSRNFICIVDFSSTTNSQERQVFYLNVIKNNVIKHLSMTDKITVIPIDKASITNSSEILVADISLKDFEPDVGPPLEADKITNENFVKYKDTLAVSFETNFNKSVSDRTLQSQGTDLIGALNNVKGYIKTNADNYIILLSDMMNYTTTLSMEPSNTDFTIGTLELYLQKLPLIEMKNTTALVLTADQPSISAEHFKLVQRFWTQYFIRDSIKLYDYSSASVSKLNELMNLPISH